MPITWLLVATLLQPAHVSLPSPRPCGVGAGGSIAPSASVLPRMTCDQPSGVRTDVLVVRVYNAAGTPAAERRDAQQISGAILGSAGIHLKWKVCDAAGLDRRDAEDCSDSPGARELVLRLIRGQPPRPAVLGFAYVPGIVATVLTDQIQETALRNERPMSLLLGAVIAHELAHLVLGSTSHARHGLMCATWTDADIRLGRIWTPWR